MHIIRFKKVLFFLLLSLLLLLNNGCNGKSKVPQLTEAEKQEILKTANDAYDNEDYQNALTNYRRLGTYYLDGISHYRYSYSLKETGELSLGNYVDALKKIENENPEHKYYEYAKNVILSNVVELDYRNAMLEDYKYKQLIKFTGKVAQISRETDIFLNTDKDNYFPYSDDRVWIEYDKAPRILEGDIIEVICEYRKTKTYETVMGSEMTVPYFDAVITTLLYEE